MRRVAVTGAAGLLFAAAAQAGSPDAGAPGWATLQPPAATAPVRRTYELRRVPGRGWVFDDSRFSAVIAQDGAVSFTDHHGALGLLLPLPLPLPEGTPTLADTLAKIDRRNRRPPPPPPVTMPGPIPQTTPYRPSQIEICHFPQPCYFAAAVMLVTAVATFDANDELVRLGHDDPYRAQKMQFLASTAELREQLRERARARARDQALAALRARLDAITAARRPVAEQRAAMESLEADLDPDPAVAGPARALIDARVRALGR